jgi:hypothetical protein
MEVASSVVAEDDRLRRGTEPNRGACGRATASLDVGYGITLDGNMPNHGSLVLSDLAAHYLTLVVKIKRKSPPRPQQFQGVLGLAKGSKRLILFRLAWLQSSQGRL